MTQQAENLNEHQAKKEKKKKRKLLHYDPIRA
jgi:hypothetical protein